VVHEIQRYLAKPWYAAPLPGMGRAYTVAWPVIGNFQVWQGTASRMAYKYWVDDSKPPLKNA
jgi:hypothetical protein